MTTSTREVFARLWADAVGGTSYVSMGREELVAYLLGHTNRLVEAVSADKVEVSVAHEIGAELVAHFSGTATLGATLTLLVQRLPGVLGRLDQESVGQVAQLVSGIAVGYASALRERTLDEQEAIHRAGLAARMDAEQALAASERLFRAMFTQAAIGIGISDLEGNVLEANPALLRMFGYTREEFLQLNVRSMVHPEDKPAVWEAYEKLARGELDQFQMDKRYYRADGEEIWTQLAVSLMRDEDGEPSYQVALLEDVSERRRLQESLQHQAYHDPLTALANRAMVNDRLASIFAEPASTRRIGVCYLDLDGFKTINDSLGHNMGDQLLKVVAARLSACCADEQLVARMGGDEFVIIVENCTGEEQMVALAGDVLATLAHPVRVGHHELTVTASIGIVECPITETTQVDLLQAADTTLYWAKDDGRGRYALFDRERNEREITRSTLSATMPNAIERDEFFLEYQPMVRLSDCAVRGVEALLRWRHPTYGVLAAEEFIGLAEETGWIVQLGRWVLARACEQASRWQDEFGERAPFVSVNLAARQLRDGGLVGDVVTNLERTSLVPRLLQLELTERAMMRHETGPLEALAKLHDIGVRIAIDDFGAGYSNLPYLRRLPLHELKLARTFVSALRRGNSDPMDERIVATLVILAHALRLTVTAEGVENLAQFERLCELGCDAGQGRLFGAPGSPEQIAGLLRSGRFVLLPSDPAAGRGRDRDRERERGTEAS